MRRKLLIIAFAAAFVAAFILGCGADLVEPLQGGSYEIKWTGKLRPLPYGVPVEQLGMWRNDILAVTRDSMYMLDTELRTSSSSFALAGRKVVFGAGAQGWAYHLQGSGTIEVRDSQGLKTVTVKWPAGWIPRPICIITWKMGERAFVAVDDSSRCVIYNSVSGEIIASARLIVPILNPTCAASSPHGRAFAGGNTFMMYHDEHNQHRHYLPASEQPITQMVADPDGNFYCLSGRKVFVYNAPANTLTEGISLPVSNVYSICYNQTYGLLTLSHPAYVMEDTKNRVLGVWQFNADRKLIRVGEMWGIPTPAFAPYHAAWDEGGNKIIMAGAEPLPRNHELALYELKKLE